MRPFSRWIPIKLTSRSTSFYSTSSSASILLHLRLYCFLSKRVSLLKAKLFPRLKALRYISVSSWGPSKLGLYLLYKACFRPLFSYSSPGWFPFFSVTNIITLEHLEYMNSCTITGCLSFSPIPHFLSEASLPSLWITLTHFALSFCERALPLRTSSYFRFGQTCSENKTF